MRVAVIGGGPSGLTTLKHLLTAHNFFPGIDPIEAILFESEDSIGGTFRYRTYENAEVGLCSLAILHYTDFRYPIEAPDFLSTKEYCNYLVTYCKKFNLFPQIQLNTRVIRVQRNDENDTKHIIHTLRAGEVSRWACDAVAICSGLHVIPNIPDIPGLSNVPLTLHSSEFKNTQQLGTEKNILILGSGETGMDIAYLAIKAKTRSVTLSHRDGFFCAPKRAPETYFFGIAPSSTSRGNVPYDVGAASLFDTSYVHPILRNSFLPWEYYDRFAKYTTWLVSGTKAGLDQWIGEISPERFHASKIFFNKSTKAVPYISAQYRRSSIINSLRSYVTHVPIIDTKGKKIDLAPWPKKIKKNGVVEFIENGRSEADFMRKKICKPDIVILATGYKQCFSFLDDDYPRASEANIRSIWKEGYKTVSFIGFVRPSFGAIPPLAELQAQLWIAMLLNRIPSPVLPIDTTHYRLQTPRDSRISYGVDHESYAYQLALDMGATASFTQAILLGWKTMLSWALGANINAKFRLVGPWKWSGAKEVMEGEVWDTIIRRRFFFGHVTLSLLPILLFGSLNTILFVFTIIYEGLERLFYRKRG
ncbi:Dimethylaniline monooxygenase 2 [Golovinomyces cichoracearum]|uniref:Dimethylaniline monooxygenase 2 n=1 Tax=Golovinomyces cichoracearum TaxID=62708 RepID=A0A420J9T3_9PEZI|nr:Dimethylaniline monooxygenase 2 [Golovinomyces cichoracearum]